VISVRSALDDGRDAVRVYRDTITAGLAGIPDPQYRRAAEVIWGSEPWKSSLRERQAGAAAIRGPRHP
jgi:hypothetical protein